MCNFQLYSQHLYVQKLPQSQQVNHSHICSINKHSKNCSNTIYRPHQPSNNSVRRQTYLLSLCRPDLHSYAQGPYSTGNTRPPGYDLQPFKWPKAGLLMYSSTRNTETEQEHSLPPKRHQNRHRIICIQLDRDEKIIALQRCRAPCPGSGCPTCGSRPSPGL